MDFNVISDFISSVGFPIVACAFMYKMNKDQRTEHREDSKALTTVLENNTTVITQLKTEIETRWQFTDKKGDNE